MPKKQTTSTKLKKPWLKYGLLTILAFVVMGFVVYSGYQSQAEKVEANRFAALQSDFKKLQVEFNKIDPGWEYSEGCRSQGGVYSQDMPSTCEVGLYGPSKLSADPSQYINKAREIIGNDDKSIYGMNSKGGQISRTGFNTTGEGYCAVNLSTDDGDQPYTRCTHTAKQFYFQRIN